MSTATSLGVSAGFPDGVLEHAKRNEPGRRIGVGQVCLQRQDRRRHELDQRGVARPPRLAWAPAAVAARTTRLRNALHAKDAARRLVPHRLSRRNPPPPALTPFPASKVDRVVVGDTPRQRLLVLLRVEGAIAPVVQTEASLTTLWLRPTVVMAGSDAPRGEIAERLRLLG
jgi:hypothetical protein